LKKPGAANGAALFTTVNRRAELPPRYRALRVALAPAELVRVAQPGRVRWREERSLEAQAPFLNRQLSLPVSSDADKPSNRTRAVYARFLAAANIRQSGRGGQANPSSSKSSSDIVRPDGEGGIEH
jgi:hypothetical protein